MAVVFQPLTLQCHLLQQTQFNKFNQPFTSFLKDLSCPGTNEKNLLPRRGFCRSPLMRVRIREQVSCSGQSHNNRRTINRINMPSRHDTYFWTILFSSHTDM